SGLAFPFGAKKREHQHRNEDDQQAFGSTDNSLTVLRQDAEASIDEFNVYPVNQQGSLAKLNEWAETDLSKSPAAPRVPGKDKHQKQPYSGHKERWAGVPVV